MYMRRLNMHGLVLVSVHVVKRRADEIPTAAKRAKRATLLFGYASSFFAFGIFVKFEN